MALGTYDQEERKRKVVYNADGTTNEEKADRSVVSAAPVQGNTLAANPDLSKALPVTQAPQPQNVGTVNVPQPKQEQSNEALTQQNVGATPPPVQNGGTFQESQSNVISGGDIKNNQGVGQDVGTSPESQVGPESSAGAENVQWAGAPQGDVTSTYNNIISPPQATPPLNAPVREFGGFSFSTVTPTGKALTDSDMDAYFGMLKKKSEETGEPIEYLDKLAGNLLVGKTQAESEEQPQIMHTITRVPDAENGKNTTTNGETSTTAAGAQPGSAVNSGASPSVIDYQRLSADTLRAMSSLERDPEKKKTIDAALAIKGEGRFDTPSINGEKESTGNDANTANGDVKDKVPELTEQEKKDKEDAKTALKEKYGSGNVDMDKRHVVSEKQMRDKGWVGARGNQSVYPQVVKIKDDKGKVHNVIMTPILPNGDILSPQELNEYAKTFNGDDNFLMHDTHGIILKVDASDSDLDELDDLTKKALAGELVSDLDSDLENEYNPDKSPTRKKLVAEQESVQKKIDELNANMNDPDVPLNSVALDEATKKLNEHDNDTEKVKKRQRTAGIIANIGDILQGFANLAGTWYGAKSSELSSLSAASNAGYERELTKREKRREELSKSIDSIKADLKKNKNTELSEWVKRLDDINKEIRKWDADAEKAFRKDKSDREKMRENTKQQNQRRAVEYAEKRALAKYQSDLRKEENAQKGSIQSGLIAQRANSRNSSNKKRGKKGKTKESEGSLK